MSKTVAAGSIDPRPVEWLWGEHIPYGMISMLAGHPEKGKSMLAMRIAADVSQEYPVIISTYEEPLAEVTRPRIEAAGAKMDNVAFWNGDLVFPRMFESFQKEVERSGAMLVVMDPISSHTSASIYHASNIRVALGRLIKISEQTDCAMLFVHHIIKNVNMKGDPVAAIGGSGGGIGAMVRAAYLFGYNPDDADERVLTHLKCNVAAKRPSLRFELDIEMINDDVEAPFLISRGECDFKAQDIFNAQPDPKDNTEKMEWTAEWLVANLREGPMDKNKIWKAGGEHGFTKLSLSKTIRVMGIKEQKGKLLLPEGFPIG